MRDVVTKTWHPKPGESIINPFPPEDEVIPRYLVLVNGSVHADFESEDAAIRFATAEFVEPSVEVVRSIRRWELDRLTGEMLEVGEKLKEQPC